MVAALQCREDAKIALSLQRLPLLGGAAQNLCRDSERGNGTAMTYGVLSGAFSSV